MSIDFGLYDSEYFTRRHYGRDGKREAMYAQERRRIIQRSNFGTILDIGCGTGEFLAGFDDRWKKYGYDPSEYARIKALKNGVMAASMDFLNALSEEAYDVITCRGALQHIDTPMQTLINAERLLKKGGLLAILATPDHDSLVYRIWGRLPALDAPRNWIVFGHIELVNILKRLGFGDIEILHPYWKTPYADPMGNFGNFALSLFFGWRPFAFPGNMMEIYARKNA